MQHSSDSSVFQTRSIDWSDRYACTSSSTRSAVRRSASSRSAIRLPLRKKLLRGALGLLGQVDLALRKPPSSRRAGRSTSSISSASSRTRVGHGLAHADAGDLRDDVVQALEVLHVERRVDVDAASSSSSTSCQRLGWREPGALVWASSSTRSSAGWRASAASRSNSLQLEAAVARSARAAGARALRAAPRSRRARASRPSRRRRPCPRPQRSRGRRASRRSCRRRPTRRRRSLSRPRAAACASCGCTRRRAAASGSGRWSLSSSRQPCAASSARGRLGRSCVERQVELQHVDARLAEHAELRPSVCASTSARTASRRQAARRGDAGHLVLRGRRR